jgi:hypothetical protein
MAAMAASLIMNNIGLLLKAQAVNAELHRLSDSSSLDALPHLHARLIPVCELDAGGLKGGADRSKIVGGRHSPPLLEISDRALAKIGALTQLGLGPIQ